MSEEQKTPETETITPETKTFSEQLEVAGKELVGKVQELIKEGNVRKVIIRGEDGRTIEVPYLFGWAEEHRALW